MAIIGVDIVHVNTQRVAIPFTVKGTLELDDQISSTMIEFSDESSSAQVAASTVTAGTATFSFVHPGYAEPGMHTLTVAVTGGASVKSNLFVVVPR